MKKRRIPIILMIGFYLYLSILTISARWIHNQSLPKVKVSPIHKETFYYTLASGITQEIQRYAIPKEIYDHNKVFVIETVPKNGEDRICAKRVNEIEVGLSNVDYYEVTKGVYLLKKLIISGYEELVEGSEVYVE